jgi:hypothetical protein
MPMMYVEDFSEFSARHGGESFAYGGRLLFPDGAQAGLGGSPRMEPPAGDYQRLMAIRLYWQARLEAAEREFYAVQSDFEYRVAWSVRGAMAGLTAANVEALRAIRDKVLSVRAELAKVEKRLAATPEEQVRRRQVENEARMQQQQLALLGEVRKIQI